MPEDVPFSEHFVPKAKAIYRATYAGPPGFVFWLGGVALPLDLDEISAALHLEIEVRNMLAPLAISVTVEEADRLLHEACDPGVHFAQLKKTKL